MVCSSGGSNLHAALRLGGWRHRACAHDRWATCRSKTNALHRGRCGGQVGWSARVGAAFGEAATSWMWLAEGFSNSSVAAHPPPREPQHPASALARRAAVFMGSCIERSTSAGMPWEPTWHRQRRATLRPEGGRPTRIPPVMVATRSLATPPTRTSRERPGWIRFGGRKARSSCETGGPQSSCRSSDPIRDRWGFANAGFQSNLDSTRDSSEIFLHKAHPSIPERLCRSACEL